MARKRNMSLEKVPMKEQDPNVRNKNFEEVTLGYTYDEAIEEAQRCLDCKQRFCVAGCPVNVPIPEFIQAIIDEDIEKAYEIITEENTLPAVCGRVCPQENQCENLCIRGKKGEPVAIGRLERFVADYYLENHRVKAEKIQPTKEKVAIVGAGPAGITCAGELAKLGYDVTIFEALHDLGGVLLYGIPEFRLPNKIVQAEIDKVRELGVKIRKNVLVGRSITIAELKEEGFKAIFVGSGAGLPRFLDIPGENLNGVYSANEFLTRVNLMKAYEENSTTPLKVGKKLAVVGGGNVAMDAARTAKRLGAEEVYIIYRRGEDELPARAEEIEHAKDEGIIFKLLTNPIEIIGEKGWVEKLKFVKMELGDPDESGRRSPVEIPASEETMDMDTVIIAIGQNPNTLIRNTTKGLSTHDWGGIIVEEDSMLTSKRGVYAGGDVVTGAATVILAMGAGKTAAKSIDEYLRAL